MRKVILLSLLLALLAVLLPSGKAMATHIRAGEITVTRADCASMDFIITVTVYLNHGSTIHFSNDGVGELNFGDGSPIHHPPDAVGSPVSGYGDAFYYHVYTVHHTYPGNGQYTVSYFEHNRNADILNMSNSVGTPFYVETVINIDPFYGCDDSPRLLVPPLDKACSGVAWYHNPGAYDPNGDSLSFEMSIPKQDVGTDVNGYFPPNNRLFYDKAGITYAIANENQDGPPGFKIDPVSGTVTWDAPGAKGEYNIAFIIKEWRKRNGVWLLLGYVTRDMQIIVEECKNKRPDMIIPADLCVEAGTIIHEDILGSDSNFDSVKMEAFSQVFSLNPSPASFGPTYFQSTLPPDQALSKFNWVTQCEHVKEQPYQVVFKITDQPPVENGPSLVKFKTWNITVVGPAPLWKSAQVPPGTRKGVLNWKRYKCAGSASQIQIWRRIDSNSFTPPNCVTGMPDIGYTLIDLISAMDSTYTDTNKGLGLAQGASYCYRLVAIFPLPKGGQSYVSQEICLPPISADAPILTNVTIDKTDKVNGQVTIKWRPPFDADPAKFPPPYVYELYRAEGFAGTAKIVPTYPGKRPDTSWVDTGINTKETIYNYRVVVYDNTQTLSDTSVTASSVRLELKPLLKQIELNWNAVVPWSNQTLQNPLHLIYRGPENSTESDLVLIDSVNVNLHSFHYIDTGKFQGIPLNQANTYCYRVVTRGGYGNPKIAEPLINYSQIICAQPNDTIPPCKPILATSGMGVDCSQYLKSQTCSPNSFTNTLKWYRPIDALCRAETRSYNIYLASQVGEDFQLYATGVADTFFIDANLPSYARCYKVAAVSRSGVESILSDPFCFDNCPSYGFPNVFTPNGDKCNELFSAWSNRFPIGENGADACGHVDTANLEQRQINCARFVNKVNFTVYNRWGKPVFTYESGGERNIYVDWDGRDDNGAECSSGVYYYHAIVNFNVVDPSKQNRTFKGWLQLIRGTP